MHRNGNENEYALSMQNHLAWISYNIEWICILHQTDHTNGSHKRTHTQQQQHQHAAYDKFCSQDAFALHYISNCFSKRCKNTSHSKIMNGQFIQ